MEPQLDLTDSMEIASDLVEIKRRREFNSNQPPCRVPAELQAMILSNLSAYDGLNLAKTCTAWGPFAGDEVLKMDSRSGDRQGLSRACSTDNLDLLARALRFGACPNDVFPWDRGMSGLNPLALAITSGCSPGFIRTLLSADKISQEALDDPRNGEMSPTESHFWTDSPLQMALLRAHSKAADPQRNPWWCYEHPGEYSHYQIPRESENQQQVYWFTEHLESSSLDIPERFDDLKERSSFLASWRNDPSRSPPLTEETIDHLQRSEVEQSEAVRDAVQIAHMLIDAGARTTNPVTPKGPVHTIWEQFRRRVCDTVHLPAQYQYHHHGHYLVRPHQRTAPGVVPLPDPAPSVPRCVQYKRIPTRRATRTPAFLALTLAELDYTTALPLLRRILDGMDFHSSPRAFSRFCFRTVQHVLWAVMTRRLDALWDDDNHNIITNNRVESVEALVQLLAEYNIEWA